MSAFFKLPKLEDSGSFVCLFELMLYVPVNVMANLDVSFEPMHKKQRSAYAKTQISYTLTAKLISAFVFATRTR